MAGYIDCYKILGVSVGAEIGDVTSSYKRLCRQYHPDINDDPDSEEMMKGINIAYSVLRDKHRREAALRERMPFSAYVRKYYAGERRYNASRAFNSTSGEAAESFTALFAYFRAIKEYDYARAYSWLSDYDKRTIPKDKFVRWRKAVARMHPLLEFKISAGSGTARVSLSDTLIVSGMKYNVKVTEEDLALGRTSSAALEKVVIRENGRWKVLLGYRDVDKLTSSFNARFEVKKNLDMKRQWEEYFAQRNAEYGLLNLSGMRSSVKRELYRHDRYGGNLTFAALAIKVKQAYEDAEEQILQSVARVIMSSLRETDIPSYVGDGVFAILFVELDEENVDEILNRLLCKIRDSGSVKIGDKAEIELTYGTWYGRGTADISTINEIFLKFNKIL